MSDWTEQFKTTDEIDQKRKQFDTERRFLVVQRADLERQIGEAKQNGTADPNWLLRSEGAFRKRGIELQEIQDKLTDLRKRATVLHLAASAEKDKRLGWKDHFVKVAKKVLEERVFNDLCRLTDERCEPKPPKSDDC